MLKSKIFKLISIIFIVLISFSQVSYSIEYKYDNLGRLTEVIYDSGQRVKYSYDASGNITNIVTSQPNVSKIITNTTSLDLQIGIENNITVIAVFENNDSLDVTKQASYYSSNPEIASVTSDGIVQGIAQGTAIITISYGGQTATVVINVREKEKSILMIVGNLSKLTAGDNAIKEHLENKKFGVILSDDNSNHPVDLEDIELIYISSSINEGNIKDKYKGANKPIIVAKPNLLKHMGMTDKLWGIHYGAQILQREINMIDSSHYIAGGLDGKISVTTSLDIFGWGVPGGEANIIATIKINKNRATIFTYNKGAKLKDNTIAAEKRVFLYLNDNTFNKANEKGIEIFDRTINWMLQQ